ncbi:hypothetical protein KCTC52924_03928 [Arenibacter antarcticus]|uniref:PorP/SprF family type IX secretion system membrane protein n=1 Tax=Arenibacter antarcticus TaxID=2040469 RepID=A0ABW5VDF7_9FLAO|nr:PorP/SprF family type IX secretion system membrane protein [Arenibacter sp. H213]MCM4169729.1 hypothetical protein [Arenibacter sp. H213]
MGTKFSVFLVILGVCFSSAQDVVLPTDFRQHNGSEFNSSLMNPVFSLDRNNPHSITFWSRYQWQNIDSDPSSWFLNYHGKINDRSSMGVGFIQHNTGVFLNTGGWLNYAHAFNLGSNMQLSFGLNVFGYNSELADKRYLSGSDIVLPQQQVSDDFILQFAPGVRLEIDDFGIGLSSDNLIDYNFTTSKTNSYADEKTFMGTLDYQFPIQLFNGLGESYLRPMVYVRSVSYGDTQVGINTLLSSSKFWVQGGYNSFYGVSGGIGGRFFKQVSLGALIEVGLDNTIKDENPSFEIVAAYSFGKQNDPKNGVEMETLEPTKRKESKKKIKKSKRKNRKAQEEELALEIQRAEAQRIKEKQENDALAEATRLKTQRRIDSIQQLEIAHARKIKADLDRIEERKKAGKKITSGHYEEVEKLESEKAGFYLVVNVYGSDRYRDIFVQSLQKKGINASYVYLPKKKHDYVYLDRYDTLSEAEAARDSKFYGKYTEIIWIFRIVGE